MSVSDPPSENTQSCLSDPNDTRAGIQDQDVLSVQARIQDFLKGGGGWPQGGVIGGDRPCRRKITI